MVQWKVVRVVICLYSLSALLRERRERLEESNYAAAMFNALLCNSDLFWRDMPCCSDDFPKCTSSHDFVDSW
ncbi:hypothetical protein M378DRAFT_167307 [Amanita muscaria Koide BX008]|uniref:Secreted protein n=1 Tax=Amanita muscaria (strain Koide BX008) TaxID=946122 RepID=A0A0C2WXL9_AMAMK|nr:hypothetical protein M378DRAFT_167307 [Amanita muscaria Koide BX008]